jgi:hypothetical protein
MFGCRQLSRIVHLTKRPGTSVILYRGIWSIELSSSEGQTPTLLGINTRDQALLMRDNRKNVDDHDGIHGCEQ